MHVPYSMDDSEPDLYGGYGGHVENDAVRYDPPTPLYQFYTTEELLSCPVVRDHVRKSLECSQRQIDALRREILEMM